MAETNLGEKPRCSSKEKKNASFKNFLGLLHGMFKYLATFVTTCKDVCAKARNVPSRWGYCCCSDGTQSILVQPSTHADYLKTWIIGRGFVNFVIWQHCDPQPASQFTVIFHSSVKHRNVLGKKDQ